MAYSDRNFKTKKALKEAVAKYLEAKKANDPKADNLAVRCHQPGMGPDLSNFTGSTALEGPHYPAAHSWYASVKMENGVVVKAS